MMSSLKKHRYGTSTMNLRTLKKGDHHGFPFYVAEGYQ